jgi:DNA-binding NtrC family response regulator
LLTVLVVEDDPDAREALGVVLEMDGLRVIGAATVADALAAGRREASIDLLVTDLSLPDGRGDAVAVALGQRHPSMRSIFLSGEAALPLSPGQRYLCKPARLGAILREVHALLET